MHRKKPMVINIRIPKGISINTDFYTETDIQKRNDRLHNLSIGLFGTYILLVGVTLIENMWARIITALILGLPLLLPLIAFTKYNRDNIKAEKLKNPEKYKNEDDDDGLEI